MFHLSGFYVCQDLWVLEGSIEIFEDELLICALPSGIHSYIATWQLLVSVALFLLGLSFPKD